MNERPEQPENPVEEGEVRPVEELLLRMSQIINERSPRDVFERQKEDPTVPGSGHGVKTNGITGILLNPPEGLSPKDRETIESFLIEGDEVISRHSDELRAFLKSKKDVLDEAGIVIDPDDIAETVKQLTLEFARGELAFRDVEHDRDRTELALLFSLHETLREQEKSDRKKKTK